VAARPPKMRFEERAATEGRPYSCRMNFKQAGGCRLVSVCTLTFRFPPCSTFSSTFRFGIVFAKATVKTQGQQCTSR